MSAHPFGREQHGAVRDFTNPGRRPVLTRAERLLVRATVAGVVAIIAFGFYLTFGALPPWVR
jgi:hypothetical protein